MEQKCPRYLWKVSFHLQPFKIQNQSTKEVHKTNWSKTHCFISSKSNIKFPFSCRVKINPCLLGNCTVLQDHSSWLVRSPLPSKSKFCIKPQKRPLKNLQSFSPLTFGYKLTLLKARHLSDYFRRKKILLDERLLEQR